MDKKFTLKMALARIVELENAFTQLIVDQAALEDTIIYVAGKAKIKEKDVWDFYAKQKALRLDAFLRRAEDQNPALAASFDKRTLDQIPTDD